MKGVGVYTRRIVNGVLVDIGSPDAAALVEEIERLRRELVERFAVDGEVAEALLLRQLRAAQIAVRRPTAVQEISSEVNDHERREAQRTEQA